MAKSDLESKDEIIKECEVCGEPALVASLENGLCPTCQDSG